MYELTVFPRWLGRLGNQEPEVLSLTPDHSEQLTSATRRLLVSPCRGCLCAFSELGLGVVPSVQCLVYSPEGLCWCAACSIRCVHKMSPEGLPVNQEG